jgi:hypothetical protein
VGFTVFAFFANQRFLQYGLYWSPILFLLGAIGLYDLVLRYLPASADRRLPIFRLSVAGLVIVNVAGALWLTLRSRDTSYPAMLANVESAVPPRTTVIADSVWWWALRDQRVYSESETLLAFNGKRIADGFPEDSAQAADLMMRTIHPDYVLVDKTLSCQSESSDLWVAWMDRVAQDCSKVTQLAGPRVGQAGYELNILGQTTAVYHCPSQ